MGSDWQTSMKEYGDEWRLQRKMFQQYFKPKMSNDYQVTQTQKIHDLLGRLATSPERFLNHIQQ